MGDHQRLTLQRARAWCPAPIVSYQGQRSLAFSCCLLQDLLGFRSLRCGNYRDSWLDNAGFLSGNFAQRITQQIGVIQAQRRDNAYNGVITLVASSRPPNPTSMTARSIC